MKICIKLFFRCSHCIYVFNHSSINETNFNSCLRKDFISNKLVMSVCNITKESPLGASGVSVS